MDKETSERVHNLIAEIAAEIGFRAWMPNHEWGERFAEALYETGDEDAIKFVMADGAEGYRSKFLSEVRAVARQAASTAAVAQVDAKDAPEAARVVIARQMEFALNVPGWPSPIPLRRATHELIAEAYQHDLKQLRGKILNNEFIKHAMDVTAPYPGRTVDDLIRDGLLSAEDFAVAV